MSFSFRKRRRVGKNSWLNISKTGVSVSTKMGNLTVNSRGGISLKLPGGMSLRGRWRR